MRFSAERLRELKLFNLQKRRLRGDLIGVYKYLMRGHEEKGARLFSVLLIDRTRGNVHKLKHKEFQLNTRKHIFFPPPVRVVKQHDRLPRDVVESPSVEILKT
ncbi:hypothetical protein QYF61_026773 [Mycteria americana]|uniref:Uncharacterized protein n=1 Tax=Mycteria americana TaxID=33587 RepID=A0AAN7P953_MYCAM|nr:hypothetical protein QYF61_026773 [Mycteria americana]